MKTKALYALLLSLTIPLSASANDKHEKKMLCGKMTKEDIVKKMEKHDGKVLKKLDLSKEQKDQIKSLRASHADKAHAQMEKIRAAHEELMAAVEKDSSKEVIRERFSSVAREKQAMMSDKLEYMLSVRDLLNTSQRQKAIAVMREEHDEMCD